MNPVPCGSRWRATVLVLVVAPSLPILAGRAAAQAPDTRALAASGRRDDHCEKGGTEEGLQGRGRCPVREH